MPTSTTAQNCSDEEHVSSNGDLARREGTKTKDKKMREELEILGKEYDLASHARTASGQLTRKVPRNQWKERTRKRKQLEDADEKAAAAASIFDAKSGRRLRGSQKAFDRKVIEDSMVFQVMGSQPESGENQEEEDDHPESSNEEEVSDDDDNSNDDLDGEDPDEDGDNDEKDEDASDEDTDVEAEDASEGEEEKEPEDDLVGNDESAKKKARNGKGKKRGRPKDASKNKKRRLAPKDTKRRQMHRLRNFQSQRLAKRHGEALAAHSRGQALQAIEILKEVAKKAPSAPQVYSSLGMVYQDMLKECRAISQKGITADADEATKHPTDSSRELGAVEDDNIITDKEKSIPDPALAEQLDLAKKAYGSYHVAAILCKKDFTLWVRAADAGVDIVNITKQVALLPKLPERVVSYHRDEWTRWQSEVLRDLIAADSLKPPGIDVACKLAAMHIELGNLSEALTIMTDLKNRQDLRRSRRSEFQSSYKAWMLYAELMLRVGHECMLWNSGSKTNDNYMFRRWLRKYSQVFDWQERRLQALCLALEAGAGTKSTADFTAWMKKRAAGGHPNSQIEEITDSQDDDTQADSERQILLAKHATDLDAFDKTTADMDLNSNSKAAKDRQVGREDLLKAQQCAVETLNNDYGDSEKQALSPQEDDELLADFGDSLPISGSCRQVCEIASELMKHLHGLELYEGVRLVGDAVSSYFKERANQHEKRRITSRRLDEWQEKMSHPSFLFATYDEKSDDENSMEGDSLPLLSDDEDLDEKEGESLLDSLRKGILPPEIRILYGLALIAEGGRNFLASKCLEAIEDLEQEPSEWLTAGEHETSVIGKPTWHLFRRAMTESLGRTAAYAFLADVLRKTIKEREWSVHFAPKIRKYLETLASVGLREQLMALRGDEDVSSLVNFRKNQVLKVILAACAFDVQSVERSNLKCPIKREVVLTKDEDRVAIALSVMKTLSDVIYLVWKVEKDGSLPPVCVELVQISSRCLRWLSNNSSAELSYNQLNTVLDYARTILSFMSGYSGIPCHKATTDDSNSIVSLKEQQWSNTPLSAGWQAEEYRPLSLRVFNLTVACNISLFSGWEPEEFTLRLLRRRHGHRHFGVQLRDDKRLAGFLSMEMEEQISRQWCEIRNILPEFPDLQVEERLGAVKETSWYKSEVERRGKEFSNPGDMARFEEEAGENLFLAYSDLCIQLATSETNPDVVNRLLHSSLSILLPVTQFCVDRRLWYSDIGEAACTLSGFDEWKLINQIGIEAAIESFEKKPKKRRRAEKATEKKVEEWIKGTGKPTWKSFVSLPLSEMRRAWLEEAECVSAQDKENARHCMVRLHEATEKLRQCYTELASEKVCLTIAKALLDLAEQPGCYDPFCCLQQAAMYASQASKAGNSDLTFREVLPEKTECTSLQALVILGRADCLHSVYFPNEAAFLCSYVATVCRMHREQSYEGDAKLLWNTRWKIVAIYAYNVSVMIRTTVSSVLDKQQRRLFLCMWERDVVEELERGRSEGWLWKRTLNASMEDMDHNMENFEADEAENSDGDPPEADGEDYDDDDDDEMETYFTQTHSFAALASNGINSGLHSTTITDNANGPSEGTTVELSFTVPPLPDFLASPPLINKGEAKEGAASTFEGIQVVSV